MPVKKKAKKKVVKKRLMKGHSPELLLSDEDSKEIKEILRTVKQNVLEPVRWARQKARWDNLIFALSKNNGFVVDPKTAGSISARARKLGYVAKLTKLDEYHTQVWFGGYEPVPKKSR